MDVGRLKITLRPEWNRRFDRADDADGADVRSIGRNLRSKNAEEANFGFFSDRHPGLEPFVLGI
jgi:hypothetical protein